MKRAILGLVLGLTSLGAIVGVVLAHGQGRTGGATTSKQSNSSPQKTTIPAQAPKAASKSTIPEEVWKRVDARLAPANEMLQQARTLLKAGDFVGAEQACYNATEMYQAQGDMGILGGKLVNQVLGDVYFAKGEYQKALASYGIASQYTDSVPLHLNAALCYLRLGNYQMAQRFYSDKLVLQYSSIHVQDLPGTSTPQSLEASILQAQGLDAFFGAQKQEAFAALDAAGKLAPNNGLISYYAGMSLAHMNRYDEAAPYFRQAAKYGRGKILEMAQRRVAEMGQRPVADDEQSTSAPQ